LQAFELQDVYKSHRLNLVARLELVSSQFAHFLIDVLKDTLLAFPIGDLFAHFTVRRLAPLHSKQTEYMPTVIKLFYRYGLDYRLIETSGFTNVNLPPADKMAIAVIDSMNYHLDTARNRTTLYALLSSLTAARVDVTMHQAKATLTTTEGPDGI
jgi:hypothetical protein